MKGAQSEQIGTALFERDVPTHDVDNVDPGEDLLNEAVGDLAAQSHLRSLAVSQSRPHEKGPRTRPLDSESSASYNVLQ